MPLRRLSARSATAAAAIRKPPKTKPLNVAVLNSSYEGSDSPTKEHDDKHCSPAHWVDEKALNIKFHEFSLKKANSYAAIRNIVSDQKIDCCYNLCDGAKDEDRAGEDVIRALESLNVPFTGADSRGFEPSKIDMKMLAVNADVRTPNFAVVDGFAVDIARTCRHLEFPVIVKHISGYASIGITKDSKCNSMKQLVPRVQRFVAEYGVALIEEFISGREGTVLACGDSSSKDGIRVFPPIMTEFAGGDDDFAHFDNKWASLYWKDDKTQPRPLPNDDPAFERIIDMARNAFSLIMHKVGYGRVDFRIDRKTGTPYFLEINPNCGMLYSQDTGGDYADLMVKYDKDWNHGDFVKCQVMTAIAQAASRKPWWHHTHNASRHFSTKCTESVPEGTPVFRDCTRPIPVAARVLFKSGVSGVADDGSGSSPQVGCAIFRGDDKQALVVVKHSCNPNLAFRHGSTLEIVTTRTVRKGEVLTVDYSTIRDTTMPSFRCNCGSGDCRRVIHAQEPKLRMPPKARPEVTTNAYRRRSAKRAKELKEGELRGGGSSAVSKDKDAPA